MREYDPARVLATAVAVAGVVDAVVHVVAVVVAARKLALVRCPLVFHSEVVWKFFSYRIVGPSVNDCDDEAFAVADVLCISFIVGLIDPALSGVGINRLTGNLSHSTQRHRKAKDDKVVLEENLDPPGRRKALHVSMQ